MTNLRVLGYVFNPASFYLCRDATGELRVVVVEVHNTHGERHLYTLRRRTGRAALRRLDGQGLLRVAVHRDARQLHGPGPRRSQSRLRITINHEQSDGLLLHASLDLARRPLTDRNVLCGCCCATRS